MSSNILILGNIQILRNPNGSFTTYNASNSIINESKSTGGTDLSSPITSNLIPSGNIYSLGNSNNLWNSLYLGSGFLYLGNTRINSDTKGNINIIGNLNVANIIGVSTINGFKMPFLGHTGATGPAGSTGPGDPTVFNNSINSNIANVNTSTDFIINNSLFTGTNIVFTSGTTYTVPNNVTGLLVRLWGAGGGNVNTSVTGGAGAYVEGIISVTAGEVYTIQVGAAGTTNVSPVYGTGGGKTAILKSTTIICVAGSGGGAGGSNFGGVATIGPVSYSGGTSYANQELGNPDYPNDESQNGGGASQIADGNPGAFYGTRGMGGDGFFIGGRGGEQYSDDGAGGAGSSWFGSLIMTYNSKNGSGRTGGNNTSSLRINNAGDAGRAGLVIITPLFKTNSYPSGPDAQLVPIQTADDEFDTSIIDTTGARRTSSLAWNTTTASSTTITQGLSSLIMRLPSGGSSLVPQYVYQTISGSSWLFRTKINQQVNQATTSYVGLIVASSAGDYIVFGKGYNNTKQYLSISTPGPTSSTLIANPNDYIYFGPTYHELEYNTYPSNSNATVLYFRYSTSGLPNTFVTVGSPQITWTPSRIGFAIGTNISSSMNQILSIDWFRRIPTGNYSPSPYVPTSATFSYTGANQTFIVPGGITSMFVELKGAGGYNTYAGGGGTGAPGGLVSGTLSVTPGETLTIVVGGIVILGGTNYTFGGGGLGYGGGGGQGGGRSAIMRNNNDIVTAGGGGGGGFYAAGGAGGGLIGANGAGGNSGFGGTQSAGGAAGGAGGNAGQLKLGGIAIAGDYIGGGGGGYYGGGGGISATGGAAGGGGSSFVANLSGTVVNTQGGGANAENNGTVSISWG